MKKILSLMLIFACYAGAQAQPVFITSGKIEYERKTNNHRLYFSDESESWTEMFKKVIPQFTTEYFDLVFTENKYIYKPGREVETVKTGFFESPAMANVVYRDLSQQTGISQKQVYETQYLLSDSLKKLVWKIEPETRTIAGFECKKAITKICDSVVVVAFYTDEIVPSGGPESFTGLPGMILGLAIPRLYTTWFATKVETLPLNEEKKIVPPAKGKKASEKEMVSTIKSAIKDWGDKYYQKAIWFVTL